MESKTVDPAVQTQITDATREAILKAAKAIKDADALLFTSGAGMSVDSGLPDFRGPQGFWRAYPPMAKLGLKFENMSNPKWFTEDPDFAWGFWAHRISLYSKTNPHAGYTTMRRWGEAKNNNYFVFTSNVDGHYAKSGYPAEKLYECHGCVNFMQCDAKCTDEIWSTTDFKIPEIDSESFRAKETLPKCKHCNSIASPNVLMFYDYRFLPNREEAQEAQFDKFADQVGDSKLVIIEIGAGQGVPTVRMLGESLVKQMPNATLVRINWTAEDAKVPKGHISLQMGGLAAINQIDQSLSEL
jgi:NAD-dependent SIR2 family protein deacetylase